MARAAMPPMTPPTIAPIGVELVLLIITVVGLLVGESTVSSSGAVDGVDEADVGVGPLVGSKYITLVYSAAPHAYLV
jgi:hypothetical protein